MAHFPSHPSPNEHRGDFPATQWTLVNRAREDSPEGEAAIEELCQRYWFPIYAFLRGKGRSPQDAEDLTQGFFQKVIRDGLFRRADQQRGKLRSLLLTILKRYVSNVNKSERRLKRGGAVQLVSFDFAEAENLYASQLVEQMDPEKIYLQAWARSLLEQARSKLRTVYEKAPRPDIAEALDPYLDPDDDRIPYREIAERFEMKEAALRLHAYRLRQKLGDLVRVEVRETVESPSEFDEELAWLRRTLQ